MFAFGYLFFNNGIKSLLISTNVTSCPLSYHGLINEPKPQQISITSKISDDAL